MPIMNGKNVLYGKYKSAQDACKIFRPKELDEKY